MGDQPSQSSLPRHVGFEKPPKSIVIATRNMHKLEEFKAILAPMGIEALSLSDLGVCGEADEVGETFRENAKLKAEYVYQQVNRSVLADDSGLVVEALGGAPGVFSARYGGPNKTDQERRQYLLGQMKDIPSEKRQAAFVCVLCWIRENGEIEFFQGKADGIILSVEKGTSGFGYDPIFLDEKSQKTFAELQATEKDQISHRGRAVASWVKRIQELA